MMDKMNKINDAALENAIGGDCLYPAPPLPSIEERNRREIPMGSYTGYRVRCSKCGTVVEIRPMSPYLGSTCFCGGKHEIIETFHF